MTQAPTPGPLSKCAHDGYEVDTAGQPVRCAECGDRLAPTAPVEASGSERDEDALEALNWIENVFPGQGDTNDQGVTVRGWQRLDQACTTIRTALFRPQPSGETRLITALKHYACSCDPGHCAMSVDDDDTACDDQLCGRTARDALLSARPLEASTAAGGGGVCSVPPAGWTCSRAAGHDGPCAASPVNTWENVK